MAEFVFAYTGGSMAQTQEERDKAMAAWGAWFGELGGAIVNPGNPFGASATVGNGSSGNGGSSGLTGFSVVSADSLDAASALAKGCPVIAHGGAVEVYEALQVM